MVIPFLHEAATILICHDAAMDGAETLFPDAATRRWADKLAPARLAGGSIADPPSRLTLQQGYALADLAADALGTPVGWKIGATSAGAMQFLDVDEPIRGRLFAERIWRDSDRASLAGDRFAEAEPEVAVLLRSELPAGEDPRPHIAMLCAAAEIVRPSHPEPFSGGVGLIVADNAAGLGVLLGPAIPLAAIDDPASIRIALTLEGGSTCEGSADAVLGNPLNALRWLADSLGSVPAGSWVMTGAMARAIPLDRSGVLTLSVPPFGTATLICDGF